MRKPTGSGLEWAKCSLVIGTGYWVQIFSSILDSSVGLSAGIQAPAIDEGSKDEAAQEKDGEPQPVIYIYEDLTKKWATVLWKAGKLVKDKQIRGCWSNDGRVFIENKFGHIELVKS